MPHWQPSLKCSQHAHSQLLCSSSLRHKLFKSVGSFISSIGMDLVGRAMTHEGIHHHDAFPHRKRSAPSTNERKAVAVSGALAGLLQHIAAHFSCYSPAILFLCPWQQGCVLEYVAVSQQGKSKHFQHCPVLKYHCFIFY